MSTKKYNGSKNIAGPFIKKAREDKHMTKKKLCELLELEGININRNELRKMENNELLIKDFEITAISKVLDIDLNILKNYLEY